MKFLTVAAMTNERPLILADRAGHGLRVAPHGGGVLAGIL